MTGDKYSAVWVSHSSLSDFLRCPQLYYLKNVYKRPETGHKMTLMTPALALGQSVHEVIESLSILPTEKRFQDSLMQKFDAAWQRVTGTLGGFTDAEQERRFKERGEAMIRRVQLHPGPLSDLAVKMKTELPHYWLSEADGIILCGKVDWLKYTPADNTVEIIDFKTGKNEEDAQSLQLPIYTLLVSNCQHRTATKAWYWYIDRENEPTERPLPNLEESHERVLTLAKDVKLARKLARYKCPGGKSCRYCQPFLQMQEGKATYVGTNSYKTDVFILPQATETMDSDVL